LLKKKPYPSIFFKTLLVLAICMLTWMGVSGQSPQEKVDSLLRVLGSAKEDTNKVRSYSRLCRNLMITGKYEDARRYAGEGLTLARKINFKKGVAEMYNQLGVIDKEQSDFNGALINNKKALSIYQEINYKPGIAAAYVNIGNVYYQQGEFLPAIQNNLYALKIAEDISDKRSMANAHMNLGNIYFSQEKYHEALESYKASLKLFEELGDKQAISFANGNIGNFYFQRNDFPQALKYYNITLNMARETGNKMSISNCLNNIGNIYFQQKNYDEALKNHLASLKLKEELGDRGGTVVAYQNLGNIYLATHKIGLASDCFNKALTISKEVGSKEAEKNSYYYLCLLDSVKGDFRSAFRHFTTYAIMKDSIMGEESDKLIQRLKVQYESDKKDQQINTQNLQLKTKDLKLQNELLEKNALRTRLYYGIAIAALVIGIVGILFYLRNRRKKKEYETQMVSTELKALKSQLNPHFIFNALNSIKSYIASNPQTGAEYLTRFSLLMRGVLEGSEEKEISLGEEMQLMQHYIELERLRLRHNVNYSITYGEDVNKDDIMIPPLITQPIIENAVWHGLTTLEREGELHIHNYLKGNILFITVSNTFENPENNSSVSIPTKRKSFGMKITRERLSLLKQTTGSEGTVNVENLVGETKVTITIPLPKY